MGGGERSKHVLQRDVFYCVLYSECPPIVEVLIFQKQCNIAKPATVYFMSGLGRENNIAV